MYSIVCQATRTAVQLIADCTAKVFVFNDGVDKNQSFCLGPKEPSPIQASHKQAAQGGAVPAVPAVRRKKKASAVKQSKSKAAYCVGTACFGKSDAAEGTPVKEAPCSAAKKPLR